MISDLRREIMPQSVPRVLYPILRISMTLDPFTATATSSIPGGSFWLWLPQFLVNFPIPEIETLCVVRNLQPDDLKR